MRCIRELAPLIVAQESLRVFVVSLRGAAGLRLLGIPRKIRIDIPRARE
jgi:hypothetical protein